MTVLPGQIWLEKGTGRKIRILESEVHGTGPAWTYVDDLGGPEPESDKRRTGSGIIVMPLILLFGGDLFLGNNE